MHNDKYCKMRMTINILSVNVGDTVTFSYSSGHNVEEVTQEAFDSCTVSNTHTLYLCREQLVHFVNISLTFVGSSYQAICYR